MLEVPLCPCRILELCQQFPHGITDQVIQNDMPHMEAQQRAVAINRLLSMVGTARLPHPPPPRTRLVSGGELISCGEKDGCEKISYVRGFSELRKKRRACGLFW